MFPVEVPGREGYNRRGGTSAARRKSGSALTAETARWEDELEYAILDTERLQNASACEAG